MSDKPVEDEITEQARHFGRALMALASQHGRAVSWLEQRRIRKEISRALRQQRQAEYLQRQMQKMHTEQAVDRYRAHAYAVQVRANSPYIDANRRARDQVALRSHAVDLQDRVLNSRSLKPVEQGIALDGIDAATAFPSVDRKGALFAGAWRVKGINALRYRATVARTREALPQQQTQVSEERRRINEPRTVETSQPSRARKSTPEEREVAVQALRRAQLDWDLNAPDANAGELRTYDGRVQAAVAAAAEAGVPKRQVEWERSHAVENSKFTASIYSTRPGSAEPQLTQTLHPTEQDAARWTHFAVRRTDWVPGVALKAAVHERGSRDPRFVADGDYEQVTARTASWASQRERQQSDKSAAATKPTAEADRLSEVEKQLKAIAADRDRMESKVGILQRGLDAVTADRDSMRSKLDAAEGRIETLTNRNQRLAAEIDEVRRDQPDIESLRAERDQYKAERDQAVARLAKRTPPRDRFGSRERVAAEGRDTERMPAPGRERVVAEGRGTEQVPFHDLDADVQQALANEMFTAYENTDSAVIREQRAGSGNDQEALNKFAQWWMDKGLVQYRTEQGQPIYRDGPNSPAPNPGTPIADRTNSRNGIERSR
ncbi:hypothetical protein [Nocardia canadensis]|uniref:hypothetical protein n=1 Tax=Nocardia canadensis TaxID=3065238 RepID=UPI002930485F|nr:hypothetical protein [Nocardia canadensis]